MITSDKITDIFCKVDDFCKVFDKLVNLVSYNRFTELERIQFHRRYVTRNGRQQRIRLDNRRQENSPYSHQACSVFSLYFLQPSDSFH